MTHIVQPNFRGIFNGWSEFVSGIRKFANRFYRLKCASRSLMYLTKMMQVEKKKKKKKKKRKTNRTTSRESFSGEGLDQLAHLRSLIKVFIRYQNHCIVQTVRMENKCPDDTLRMSRMILICAFCICSKKLFRLTRATEWKVEWSIISFEHD